VQAPNHYHIRPWRFVVMTGKSHEALGKVMARSLQQQNPGLPIRRWKSNAPNPCAPRS
jgi:nitroreductase